MLGALIGDYVSSAATKPHGKMGPGISDLLLDPRRNCYSGHAVQMAATAHALVHQIRFEPILSRFMQLFPCCEYTPDMSAWPLRFAHGWEASEDGSAAVRAIPIGMMKNKAEDWVLEQARINSTMTHDTKRAIDSAQAVALTLHMLLNDNAGMIELELYRRFDYVIDMHYSFVHTKFTYAVKAAYSVPAGISIGLNARCFEDALRAAEHIGGDTPTISAIAGQIAAIRFGVVDIYRNAAMKHLFTYANQILLTYHQFHKKFGLNEVEIPTRNIDGEKTVFER